MKELLAILFLLAIFVIASIIASFITPLLSKVVEKVIKNPANSSDKKTKTSESYFYVPSYIKKARSLFDFKNSERGVKKSDGIKEFNNSGNSESPQNTLDFVRSPIAKGDKKPTSKFPH